MLREDAVRFGASQAGLFDMHPEFSWEWRGACWIVRARQSSKSCFAWAWWNMKDCQTAQSTTAGDLVPTVWLVFTEALHPCFCRSVTIYSEKMPRSNLRGAAFVWWGFILATVGRDSLFSHVFPCEPCFFPYELAKDSKTAGDSQAFKDVHNLEVGWSGTCLPLTWRIDTPQYQNK